MSMAVLCLAERQGELFIIRYVIFVVFVVIASLQRGILARATLQSAVQRLQHRADQQERQ